MSEKEAREPIQSLSVKFRR